MIYATEELVTLLNSRAPKLSIEQIKKIIIEELGSMFESVIVKYDNLIILEHPNFDTDWTKVYCYIMNGENLVNNKQIFDYVRFDSDNYYREHIEYDEKPCRMVVSNARLSDENKAFLLDKIFDYIEFDENSFFMTSAPKPPYTKNVSKGRKYKCKR